MRFYCLYAVNFIAAFLLFQIELIVSKILLPQFGGSYLVWGSCVVFFQCVLLLGYVYAHFAVQRVGMKRYRPYHLALVVLPFLFFPGRPLLIQASGSCPMVVDVFIQLSFGIGLVFFVLSTISLVTQSWLAASSLSQRENPYLLYAVSNIGSFLALLSYPFVFEFYFDIGQQLLFWRIGYFVFFLLYLLAYILIRTDAGIGINSKAAREVIDDSGGLQAGRAFWGRWLLLSAAGSVLFLSVTNIITYEMAPCSLLWVVPLAVYLLTYVLVFQDKPLYPRWMAEGLPWILGFCSALFFLTRSRYIPAVILFGLYVLAVFLLCLACQRELYVSRPRDKRGLTYFYVILSAGSFIGGIMVTWIAPLVFSVPAEYLLGLLFMALGLAVGERRDAVSISQYVLIGALVVFVLVWPQLFVISKFWGVLIFVLIFGWSFSKLRTESLAVPILQGILILIIPFFGIPGSPLSYVERTERNYYGIYYVSNMPDGQRFFLHGMTVHGIQLLDPAMEQVTTAYYHSRTPVGKYLLSSLIKSEKVGVIGLGVGTLAVYGREGQQIDFYELDPYVGTIAQSRFSFLKRSKADIKFFYGDARIRLKKSSVMYDLLIVDAFSGDSVPVHLLTTEALRDYQAHLSPQGVLLFHVTNRYFDLVPVLFSNACELGAYSMVDRSSRTSMWEYGSTWVAITWDKASSDVMVDKLGWKDNEHGAGVRAIRSWSDRYSHLISVLIRQDLWGVKGK